MSCSKTQPGAPSGDGTLDFFIRSSRLYSRLCHLRRFVIFILSKSHLMPNTNQPVPSQKQARSLKFLLSMNSHQTIYAAKTKALISCAVTA